MQVLKLFFVVFLFVSTVAFDLRVSSASLITGLQGYWQFDGDGNDQSGNNLDLAITGGAGFDSGLIGQALDLPGDSTMFAIRGSDDTALDFGSGDFTMQAWVNWNSVTGTQTFMEKFTGPSGPGWTFEKLDTQAIGFFAGGGIGTIASPVQSITTGAWHQLVAVRDGSTIEIYFDNNMVAAGSVGTSSISDTNKGLLIGERDGGQNHAINGLIDEVAIWDRPLSNAEISSLYNNGFGAAIPEPSSLALMGLGLLALGGHGWLRRKRKHAA